MSARNPEHFAAEQAHLREADCPEARDAKIQELERELRETRARLKVLQVEWEKTR